MPGAARGLFQIPQEDPYAPPRYVSVTSSWAILLVQGTVLLGVAHVLLYLAIFTNNVCAGAGNVYLAVSLTCVACTLTGIKVGHTVGYIGAAAQFLSAENDV